MNIHGLLLYFGPIFFTLVLIEVVITRRRGKPVYTRGETIATIVIAIVQRVVSLLPLSLASLIAMLAWDNRIFEFDTSTWYYIPALFLAQEFTYYWSHRFSHTIRWFWATHAVHHSTTEMNILSSYRFGWTGWLSMASIFFVPLYLIGFNPVAVNLVYALNLMYQSTLHTTIVGKLGPIEGILNTPSAHRVHHASNPEYVDKNYGGVLIIFDRLFGTYVEEKDQDALNYGLVKPVASVNPIRIVFHEWSNIVADIRASSPKQCFKILFGRPGSK